MDKGFRDAIGSNKGTAVIFAGSGSDESHIEKISKSLVHYGIPHRTRICSAHKQPEELMRAIQEYESVRGLIAYIAVAGGTDALSGTLSYHTSNPVISCPPDAPNNSCLTNPPGSSNAYIARPQNVGRFVAQMYAHLNPHIFEELHSERIEKLAGLASSDVELNEKYRLK